MEASSLYQDRYGKGNLTLCKYKSPCVVTKIILLRDQRKTASITDKNRFISGANPSLNLMTINLIYFYTFVYSPPSHFAAFAL